MRRTALVLLTLMLSVSAAAAGLSRRDLAAVALSPRPDAALPFALRFQDVDGRKVTLADAIDHRPAAVMFVDYTCRTVCKPALAIVAAALADSGLPADSYRLVLVGIDPKDNASDARELMMQIGDRAVAASTVALLGDGTNVGQLAEAMGYRFAYDVAIDQYAHPAGLVAVTPSGRIARVLSSLAVDASDLRLAMVEAGEGKIGTLTDRLTLLCYGFDPAHGIYTSDVQLLLEVACGLTLLTMIGLFVVLRRRERSVPGTSS